MTIGALPGGEPLQGEVGPWSSANKQWNQDVSYDTGNCRQNSKVQIKKKAIKQNRREIGESLTASMIMTKTMIVTETMKMSMVMVQVVILVLMITLNVAVNSRNVG